MKCWEKYSFQVGSTSSLRQDVKASNTSELNFVARLIKYAPRPFVEANFLSGVFSPVTSAEASEKSSRWLWKRKLC